jgi:hypothetical protein
MASVPFKSTAISGSIERTTADKSYLVAGSNVTITTGSGGQITIASTGGGGGTPGGSDTQVQYNSNGAFAGSASLTFVSTGSADSTGLLLLTGSLAVLSGSTEGGINMQRGGGSVSIGKNSFATPTDLAASSAANFAHGYGIGSSYIKASGLASFAQGLSAGGGNLVSTGAGGSFAQGQANSGGINAINKGTFAQGHDGGGGLTASGLGSFAQGQAGGIGVPLSASAVGSFAQGYAGPGGALAATGSGSFAQGVSSNGVIEATGYGSFAQGIGTIKATGAGAFARGFTAGSYQIHSSGGGSFAVGRATAGDINATANNSFQIGEGTNDVTNSVQAGSKTPGPYDAKAIRIASNLSSGGDIGDITTQRKVLAPDGTQAPSSANETKLVMSGSTVEKHAGVGNFADGEFAGEIMYIGGGSVTAGLVYYLGTGGSWTLASGDASSAMSGSLVGMAIDTGNVTDKGILLRGFYKLPTSPNTGSYTIGAALYVSTGSDGYVIDSPPGVSGQIVRIVGHNVTNNGLLWFNPDGNYIINS